MALFSPLHWNITHDNYSVTTPILQLISVNRLIFHLVFFSLLQCAWASLSNPSLSTWVDIRDLNSKPLLYNVLGLWGLLPWDLTVVTLGLKRVRSPHLDNVCGDGVWALHAHLQEGVDGVIPDPPVSGRKLVDHGLDDIHGGLVRARWPAAGRRCVAVQPIHIAGHMVISRRY